MTETTDQSFKDEEQINDQERNNTELAQRTLDRFLSDPQISYLGAKAVGELGLTLPETKREEKPIDLTLNNLDITASAIEKKLTRNLDLSDEAQLGVTEIKDVLIAEKEKLLEKAKDTLGLSSKEMIPKGLADKLATIQSPEVAKKNPKFWRRFTKKS